MPVLIQWRCQFCRVFIVEDGTHVCPARPAFPYWPSSLTERAVGVMQAQPPAADAGAGDRAYVEWLCLVQPARVCW